MRKILSKNRTIGILFLEGFVSVSLQMIMMRQLVPFVGSSVIVSSLVIGFFLASLSLGYAVGGRKKDGHINKLVHNIFISAIILSAGLSYTVMDNIFIILNKYIDNSLIEVSLYLLVFLSPIVFLLGQTVPLLTNFYKSNSVSEVVGDSFAINTVGSVLGSVVTSLVFFNVFGMSVTILIDVLLLGSVLFILLEKECYFKYGMCYSVIIAFCYFLNVNYEKSKFVLTNAYNNYEVVEVRGGRYFIMNKGYSSGLMDTDENWYYIEKTKEFLFGAENLNIQNSDVLILGAGGFTLTYGDKIPNNNNYVYIDIDPDIQKVAEENFLKRKIKGNFTAEDARLFINKSKIKYDAIVVDLYANQLSIPWHLITKDFIKEVKDVTTENGVVVFNMVSDGFFGDKYTRTIYNTIKSEFDYCHSVPLGLKGVTNVLYICKNISEEYNEKELFIDDKSRSPIDEITSQ